MPSMLSMPSRMLSSFIVFLVSSLDTVRTAKDSRTLISRFFSFMHSRRRNTKKGRMPSMPSKIAAAEE